MPADPILPFASAGAPAPGTSRGPAAPSGAHVPEELLPLHEALVAHDRLPETERPAFLAALVGIDPDHAMLADVLADPFARPLLEWSHNGCVTFEGARALIRAKLLIPIPEYLLWGPGPGREMDFITGFDLAPRAMGHRMKAWRLPDGTRRRAGDLPETLEPLIEDYVARSGPQGVVLGRDAMEAAFAAGDVELLRLARDPLRGWALIALSEAATFPFRQGLLAAAPDDAPAARRRELPMWSHRDRGVALRDASGLPDAATMWAVPPSLDDPAQDGPWEWQETGRP